MQITGITTALHDFKSRPTWSVKCAGRPGLILQVDEGCPAPPRRHRPHRSKATPSVGSWPACSALEFGALEVLRWKDVIESMEGPQHP